MLAISQPSFLSSENGLSKYMKEMRSIPVLSVEEEYELAVKWKKNNDIKAAQALVLSHVKLVVKIAYTFRGYGLPMMDLISEGNIGLMKAVKKFDPEKGYRLATYAMWWIKATIQDYILKSWSMVKVGTSAMHKKIFFNLKKVKDKLMRLNSESDSDSGIEKAMSLELGISQAQLKSISDGFGNGISLSLQDQMNEEGEQDRMSSFIPEDEEGLEQTIIDLHDKNKKLGRLSNAMMNLSDRERDIVISRHLSDDPATLHDLSIKHHVSSERIRQIEECAMKKIKSLV